VNSWLKRNVSRENRPRPDDPCLAPTATPARWCPRVLRPQPFCPGALWWLFAVDHRGLVPLTVAMATLSDLDFSHGLGFQEMACSRFGVTVTPLSSSSMFLLVASFSRSVIRIDSDSVSLILPWWHCSGFRCHLVTRMVLSVFSVLQKYGNSCSSS
jgi:hypothetical protein